MGVKITALSAVDPLDGTEILAAVQTTTKRVTTSEFATYILDVVAWAEGATAAPASGDLFFGFNSGGTQKRLALNTLVTYIGDELATAAAAAQVEAPVTADSILIERENALEGMAIDNFVTYCLDGGTTDAGVALKASIRDMSGLTVDAGPLTGTDLLMVDSGSTLSATVAVLAAYVHAEIDTYLAAADPITLADGDMLYVRDLSDGAGKRATALELSAYVETTISASIIDDVWDNASAAQAPGNADVFVMEVSNVRYKTTATLLNDYIAGKFNATTITAPATSYNFLAETSGTNIRMGIDAVADYIGDYLASGVTAVTPLATDHVMLNDAGVLEKVLVSTLNTKMLDGTTAPSTTLRDAVLTFNGGTLKATPAGTEFFAMDDAGTASYATLDNLATFVYADTTGGLNEYVNGLTDAAPIVDGDEFFVQRGSGTAGKKIAASDLLTYMKTGIWGQWNTVSSGKYTALPPEVDRILMSDTTGMEIGVPLRYAYGGTTYYGIVKEVSANSYIELRGATLNTGVVLTALAYGLPSRTRTLRLEIPGAYLTPWCMPDNDANADGANDSEIAEADMLADIARRYVEWREADAYLVAVSATHRTADGNAQSYFNVSIGGTGDLVLSEASNKGIQLSTAGAWVTSGQVAIATGNYKIVEDDAIEVKCTAPATADGEASDVSLELVFVFE